MRNFHPSCRLTSGDADLSNPTEGELLTCLGAVAAGKVPELLLARPNGEALRASVGSSSGMVRLSKDKGAGRGVFDARGEVALAVAERVLAAHLAGDPDFDRGLKWEPARRGWRGLAVALAILLALVGLLLLA